ncbi:MAG: hypothetical protein IPN22_11035 [Bacteroidetes bacterium]|nr:hypothetical protein [Bacteroidota bacterium]
MKKFLIAFALFGVYSISAQPTSPRLSAAAHQYFWRVKNEPAERNWVYPGYVLQRQDGTNLLSTFLKVEDGFSEDALQALGVSKHQSRKHLDRTSSCRAFQELSQLSGLRYIDMDAPVALPRLSTRCYTRRFSA